MNELRLQIKLKSPREDQSVPGSASSFSMMQESNPEESKIKEEQQA
jgi:twitching motility protein PilU